MHAIPPAATGNPAHQRAAVAAASRGGGRDARGANGRPTAAGEGRDARGANGQPFTTNEPSPAAATRGKGGRGRPNPPWFTPPRSSRNEGGGGAAVVHPPTKLPATRGGGSAPVLSRGRRGAPPRGGAQGQPINKSTLAGLEPAARTQHQWSSSPRGGRAGGGVGRASLGPGTAESVPPSAQGSNLGHSEPIRRPYRRGRGVGGDRCGPGDGGERPPESPSATWVARSRSAAPRRGKGEREEEGEGDNKLLTTAPKDYATEGGMAGAPVPSFAPLRPPPKHARTHHAHTRHTQTTRGATAAAGGDLKGALEGGRGGRGWERPNSGRGQSGERPPRQSISFPGVDPPPQSGIGGAAKPGRTRAEGKGGRGRGERPAKERPATGCQAPLGCAPRQTAGGQAQPGG